MEEVAGERIPFDSDPGELGRQGSPLTPEFREQFLKFVHIAIIPSLLVLSGSHLG